MIQIWKYDENKIFIESCMVEELEESMTTVPLTIGYIKPKFSEELEEWYEGATKEELQKWEEDNKQVDKTKICTMKDLQEENKKLWDTVEYLLKQSEAGIPHMEFTETPEKE